MNWRRSDVISLGTLFTVLAWVWYASAKTTTWDENTTQIKEIKVTEDSQGKQLAVLIDNVDEIKDDLRFLRRHAR